MSEKLKIINLTHDEFYFFSVNEIVEGMNGLGESVISRDIGKAVIIDGFSLLQGMFVIKNHLFKKKSSIMVIATEKIINLMSISLMEFSHKIIWFNKKSKVRDLLINLSASQNHKAATKELLQNRISQNEIDVFKLYLYGCSYEEIASLLKMECKAISYYKMKVFRRINVKTLSNLLSFTTTSELIKYISNIRR